MSHSGAILSMVLKICHGSFPSFDSLCAIILPSLSANSASFFTLSLWPLNGIFWITQFHNTYNGSDSLPGFFNTSLVSSILYLYVKWNTFFIRISLPLYHSFIQGWFASPSFENFPLSVLSQKSKNLVPLPVKEKSTMKQIVYETTKVNIPNFLKRTTKG